MQNYRKTTHSVYDIKYHIVWITKYRKPFLTGEVARRVREVIRQICKSLDVEIIKGHASRDHIHLFVSVPHHLSVSELVKQLKGKSSWKIISEFKAYQDNIGAAIFGSGGILLQVQVMLLMRSYWNILRIKTLKRRMMISKSTKNKISRHLTTYFQTHRHLSVVV